MKKLFHLFFRIFIFLKSRKLFRGPNDDLAGIYNFKSCHYKSKPAITIFKFVVKISQSVITHIQFAFTTCQSAIQTFNQSLHKLILYLQFVSQQYNFSVNNTKISIVSTNFGY